MSNEYNRGFTAGHLASQPEWISMKDRLPDRDGSYYTITELQKDLPNYTRGTINIDSSEVWEDGKWYQDDDIWKVLYWANPIKLDVPDELSNRPRLGSL